MSNEDIIKMNTDINITDSNGNPIQVNTQSPEFLTETFAWDGVECNSNSSKNITGDK
ncbi:MAG: hypothetical protein NC430_10695 [bacterium]|nr:hypothetical protein [bacterium]MCM1423663.1 hypothetical protein [bacterium]